MPSNDLDKDAHVENREPEVDTQQNWKLLGAWEKGNRTYLSFSRPFDTCDPQDYAITVSLTLSFKIIIGFLFDILYIRFDM